MTTKGKRSTPALFSVRMRRVYGDKTYTEWGARYGFLTVFVKREHARAGASWFIAANGIAVFHGEAYSVELAARAVEKLIRQVGKALPGPALVSAAERKRTNG